MGKLLLWYSKKQVKIYIVGKKITDEISVSNPRNQGFQFHLLHLFGINSRNTDPSSILIFVLPILSNNTAIFPQQRRFHCLFSKQQFLHILQQQPSNGKPSGEHRLHAMWHPITSRCSNSFSPTVAYPLECV